MFFGGGIASNFIYTCWHYSIDSRWFRMPITISNFTPYSHTNQPIFLAKFRLFLQISGCGYSTFQGIHGYTGYEWNVSSQGILIMSHEQVRTRQPLYTQIDVASSAYPPVLQTGRGEQAEMIRLLRELLTAQDRQNELLEELVNQLGATGKQRANELGQWKQANPHLARSCRLAAEALGKVQTEFLEALTQEVNANYESLLDGEFMLNEFVDRFGPRMAHLNGLLQVLSQLSATPNPANTPNAP